MENQHRKITGYRELNQQEIDLMNKVKALGPLIEEVLIDIEVHLTKQVEDEVNRLDEQQQANASSEVYARLKNATPDVFLVSAKSNLQIGMMLATRAIAQPEFF